MTATNEQAAENLPPAPGTVFAAYRREAKAMLRLSAPIMATQMLWMAVGIADVIMIGTLGAVPLAAVALGSALFYFFFVPAMGFLQAVSPIAAHAIGADGKGLDRNLRKAATTDDLRDTCRSGLWVAVLGSLPIILIVLFSETILLALGQDPALAEQGALYNYLRLPALPFVFMLIAMRGFAAAMDRPRPALAIAFVMFSVNVFLNWVLIFGNLGAPALGIAGAAIASAIADLIGFTLMALVFRFDPDFHAVHAMHHFFQVNWSRVREICRVGWPIAVSMSFEVGVFSAAVALIGLFGADAVAGHQIAINVASATFMVPMGIASAAAVRVGYAAGARDPHGMRIAGHAAIAMSATFMLAMGFVMWFAPGVIVSIYVDPDDPINAAAGAFATSFLAVAALFQLFDGLQVSAAGALRGLKDTRVPMLIAGAAYWLIAFPAAAALAFPGELGAVGVWYGLAAGLAIAAVLMVWRFELLTRKGVGAG